MLLNGSFGKVNEEQKNIIQKIYQRNKYLISLINDLLDNAKLEETAYACHLAPVDLEDIIESAIKFHEEEVKMKSIILAFEKPAVKLPKIMLDKGRMYLAILNIIDNAIKYTHKGGTITISLRKNKESAEFKIQDSGIGIPENQKKHLFDKFFRANNAIKVEIVGSGLGLFIAKSIIESHHGKIWFDSKENQGSIFFFSLPIKPLS